MADESANKHYNISCWKNKVKWRRKMQALELYEQKIISDDEFPVQLHINDIHKKGYYFMPHWHEHIELHYILEGKTKIKLNQNEIIAQKGNLVIANSNELHAGYCDGDPVKALVVIFELGALSKEAADKNIILQSLVEKDEKIDGMMKQIWEENEAKALGYRLLCKGILLQLITHLIRNYTKIMLSDYESLRRMKQLERLNTVIYYIEGHYTEQISNKELADLIHLSEDRFNHLFKESMSMAPLQYINEMRLKKAKCLLKQNEFTVSEVAMAVGFRDYNHFGRMFRKLYGCSPLEATGWKKK